MISFSISFFVKRALVLTLFAATVSTLTVACKVGETTYASVTTPFRAATPTRTCNSPFANPDLSTLKACGGDSAKAHCYDATKVPVDPTELPALTCDAGESCVPDKMLTANGGKAKSCAFFIDNKPGACVSLLTTDISAHKDELKQDVCDADERCAPCISPLDGSDTKVCEASGVYQDACVGGVGSEAPSCCHGAGICSKKDGIPADDQSDLSQDVCPAEQLCAPAALVDGNPVKCDVLGVSGVCIDVCFSSMLRGAENVLKGGCGPTEVCLPCAIGKGQGLPGC